VSRRTPAGRLTIRHAGRANPSRVDPGFEFSFGCDADGVEPFEETDELARPMAIFHTGVHATSQKVDPCKQAERALPLVYMVAGGGGIRARLRRQIGRRVADGLVPRVIQITG